MGVAPCQLTPIPAAKYCKAVTFWNHDGVTIVYSPALSSNRAYSSHPQSDNCMRIHVIFVSWPSAVTLDKLPAEKSATKVNVRPRRSSQVSRDMAGASPNHTTPAFA